MDMYLSALVFGLLLCVVVFVFLFYMGWFHKIQWKEEMHGPWNLVYTEHIGAYHHVGPVFDKVDKDLIKIIPRKSMTKGLGIYYDDPSKTDEKHLRTCAGTLIEHAEAKSIDDSFLAENNLKKVMFPTTKYICGKFPLRNQLSYMIGPMRAYSQMNAHIKAHYPDLEDQSKDCGALEVYDMQKGYIWFMIPLEHFPQFSAIAPAKRE